MLKEAIQAGDIVEVISGNYAGRQGQVFFVDPVKDKEDEVTVSLSIGVRLDGNIPIRISLDQLVSVQKSKEAHRRQR